MGRSRWGVAGAAVIVAAAVSTAAAQSPALKRIQAAERGDTPEVRALVTGQDPNARDAPHLRTALMWSILLNDRTAFDRFIAIPGAEVNAADSRGETALTLAAEAAMKHNTTPMVEALIAKGAAVAGSPEPGAMTPLMHAANGNVPGVARALLARLDAAALERRNAMGMTALAVGAAVGATDVVRLLLERGAKVEASDERGKTPLIHAAGHHFPGSLATVTLLLEKGGDPNARDKEGNTPLSEARKRGAPGVEGLLRKSGAR